jgi:hypothetical protein
MTKIQAHLDDAFRALLELQNNQKSPAIAYGSWHKARLADAMEAVRGARAELPQGEPQP